MSDNTIGGMLNSIMGDIKRGTATDPRLRGFYKAALEPYFNDYDEVENPQVRSFLRLHGNQIGISLNAMEKTTNKYMKGEFGVDKLGQKHSHGCAVLYCLDQAKGQADLGNYKVGARYLWGAVRKLGFRIPNEVWKKLDFGKVGDTAEFLANWLNDEHPDLFNDAMHCTCDHEENV